MLLKDVEFEVWANSTGSEDRQFTLDPGPLPADSDVGSHFHYFSFHFQMHKWNVDCRVAIGFKRMKQLILRASWAW